MYETNLTKGYSFCWSESSIKSKGLGEEIKNGFSILFFLIWFLIFLFLLSWTLTEGSTDSKISNLKT